MKGEIYAPLRTIVPVNLLGNSWFIPQYLVNQRGQASYTTLWGMTIDRWYLSSHNSEIPTMILTEDGLRFIGGDSYIQTRIPPNIDATKLYTIGYCIDGNIVILYCTPEYIGHSIQLHGFIPIQIEHIPNGATIQWVAMYEGAYTADTFPPPKPHPFSTELAECRRWYLPLNASKWYEATRPYGDVLRFEVLGSFARTPTLIGSIQGYGGDGVWHDLEVSTVEYRQDRTIFRIPGMDSVVTPGMTYLLTGVSGVSCEL